MRARVPDVLAAGDDGHAYRARDAAADGGPLPVLLKGLGIDVASVGRIVAGADDTVVHHESPDGTATDACCSTMDGLPARSC